MTRLPQPGSDKGTWGVILNEYLAQAHNDDGTLKDASIVATKLATAVQTSLAHADAAYTGLSQKANQSTTYTKTEVDAAISSAQTETFPYNPTPAELSALPAGALYVTGA